MKIILSIAAVLACAGTSMADLTVTAQPLDSGVYSARDQVVYSSIPGPYQHIAGGLNSSVSDDFTTTLGAAQDLTAMRFVGGVADATTGNNVLHFSILDLSSTEVGAFDVAIPQAGNFIWTINGFAGSGVQVPTGGTFTISSGTATTTMSWFTTNTAASPGTNVADANGEYQSFELTVPSPTGLAALGMGALAFGRRRRR